MADPRAMKRMWRTLRPRFRMASEVFSTAPIAPEAVLLLTVETVLPVRILLSKGACCMRIPSRHWEGDRYPADHGSRSCDGAHGALLSLIPDWAGGGKSPIAAVRGPV